MNSKHHADYAFWFLIKNMVLLVCAHSFEFPNKFVIMIPQLWINLILLLYLFAADWFNFYTFVIGCGFGIGIAGILMIACFFFYRYGNLLTAYLRKFCYQICMWTKVHVRVIVMWTKVHVQKIVCVIVMLTMVHVHVCVIVMLTIVHVHVCVIRCHVNNGTYTVHDFVMWTIMMVHVHDFVMWTTVYVHVIVMWTTIHVSVCIIVT